MTTLAELVAATPAYTRGAATQIAYGTGTWRFVVELADPSAGASVVWYDITDDVAGYRLDRGADQYAGKYKASVATVELIADADTYAPWNEDTSATFGTHVTLGAGLLIRAGFIRVSGTSVEEWLPRFTNRVESWSDAGYARGKIRRHTIVTRDLMTGLVNVPVVSQLEQNWFDRAESVLTAADWDYDHTIHGAQKTSGAADILTLPTRAEQSSGINELDATLDNAGIVWRTDRTGKIIAHEQVGDTFHADAFTAGATGTAYTWPTTITASYLAEDAPARLAYAVDDNALEPFGFDSTELGVVNRLIVTDTGTYDTDDPTSIARHGYRPRAVTWQADNDAVADDILARLKDATIEARPLSTSVDLPGFMANAPGLDHLSPIAIQHTSGPDRSVVTGDGHVRSLVEQVAPRADGGVAWTIQIVADIASTDQVDELLPVTSLAAGSITDTSVLFSWTNPTQTITPTETQVRMAGTSIWLELDYPITSLAWPFLTPDTAYSFEVRLIRQVAGIITNVSPVRSVDFTTLAPDAPYVTDPGDGTIDVTPPTPASGCTLEWVLEETSDSTTWTTADSGSVSAAPWDINIPATSFTTEHLYRVKSRETCSGVPGAYVYSAEFVHECTTPVVIADAVAPYDESSLLLYVPKVCPPDQILDAAAGDVGFHGNAYGGLVARWDAGGDIAVKSSGDGFIAGGSAAALTGWTGDGTISCLANVDNAAYTQLFTAGPMRLTVSPSAGGWKPSLIVFTDAGQLTILGSELAESTPAYVSGTYDESTGTATLYVNGAADGTTTASVPGPMISTLPWWYLAGPDGTWVTEAAAWAAVTATLPGTPASGGIQTDSGGYRYHEFRSPDGANYADHVLELNVASLAVEYLWVGSGGGGCRGGGGGGEARSGSSTITGDVEMFIGGRGSGAPADGGSGATSGVTTWIFSDVTANHAYGGGLGGQATPGGGGGCGGGGGADGASTHAGGTPITSPRTSTGAAGGWQTHTPAPFPSGGGGGALTAGGNTTSNTSGAGGGGREWPTGSGNYYGGGGGGGTYVNGGAWPAGYAGAGGAGGGGAGGAQAAGTAGTDHLGGGGGGAGQAATGGNGGSGVVIFRYVWPPA